MGRGVAAAGGGGAVLTALEQPAPPSPAAHLD